MEPVTSVWSKLDTRRRIVVIGASLAVFAAVLMLGRGAANRDMALLYGGLDGAAAGEVLTILDQRGVIYDVRGGAIFVPTRDRDMLRMTLAGEGLPTNGAQGYELLDSLSGFGTTSQMFDAAYWRAKEGELARTMLASPHIRAARVHISASAAQPFRRDLKPTAAVNVTTARGTLDPAQAEALRFLVASSVPGMAPADVAVIDGSGGLVVGLEDAAGARHADDRAAELKARVERILAAHLGPGNAVVEVSVETVTETEAIRERRIDPESRVAISTDVEENASKSNDSRGGDVTVASNLPEGDAEGTGGTSANESSTSRQVTNFEISETERELLRAPGAVRRLSVAVLVNTPTTINDAGERLPALRSEEDLADLQELVAAAVGYDESRGDDITIRAMPFEPVDLPAAETGTSASLGEGLDMMHLIQIAVLAIVALILGLFVVRPILLGRRRPPLQLDDSRPPALPGTATEAGLTIDAPAALSAPDQGPTEAGPDPVARLRELIDERRDEALQVLQSWIEEPQDKEVRR